MDTVLIFDLDGKNIGTLAAKRGERLDGPSALAVANGKLYILNMAGNRVTAVDL
jgi:hypothetical protein